MCCFCLKVSVYAAHVYDATILYALTVDKMIKSGIDYRDGEQFMAFAETIVFTGVLL